MYIFKIFVYELALCCCDRRHSLKEMFIFGSVSGVVHSVSPHFLCDLWQGSTSWQRKTAHLMAARKQQEKEVGGPAYPFKGMRLMTRGVPLQSPQPRFWNLPIALLACHKAFHRQAFGRQFRPKL